MPLAQPHRDVLLTMILGVLPNAQTRQNFINTVRPGGWDAIVTLGSTYENAIRLVIEAACTQGWICDLMARLVADFPNQPAFVIIRDALARSIPWGTTPDPVEEVWLASSRPFANRRALRARLRSLLRPDGEPVLLIDGGPKTGKSYSQYLISHVASAHGFSVNPFDLQHLPKPDEFARQILGRLAHHPEKIPALSREGVVRWADDLADIIMAVILAQKTRRLFVIDESSDVPLPEGTADLIVRLAKYADSELRSLLRIVLVRFRGELPQELSDVALRDTARPFSSTDMLELVSQVVQARCGSANRDAIWTKITAFDAELRTDNSGTHRSATLNERFHFMRFLVEDLEQAATPPAAVPQ